MIKWLAAFQKQQVFRTILFDYGSHLSGLNRPVSSIFLTPFYAAVIQLWTGPIRRAISSRKSPALCFLLTAPPLLGPRHEFDLAERFLMFTKPENTADPWVGFSWESCSCSSGPFCRVGGDLSLKKACLANPVRFLPAGHWGGGFSFLVGKSHSGSGYNGHTIAAG